MADLYGSKVLQLHLQLDERPAGVVQLHLAPPRVGTKVHHFASLSIELGLTVESLQLHASADGNGRGGRKRRGEGIIRRVGRAVLLLELLLLLLLLLSPPRELLLQLLLWRVGEEL